MDLNYELLEETKKEIKEMIFFKENIEVDAQEFEVINNYDQAFENAFERIYTYGELDGQTWIDILEENMAKVKKVIYQYENYTEYTKQLRNIEIPELQEIVFTLDDYDVQEEIYNEIELCVKSRLVCGKDNEFFENLYKVYKLGGWPCGWGNGKIIVYVP